MSFFSRRVGVLGSGERPQNSMTVTTEEFMVDSYVVTFAD